MPAKFSVNQERQRFELMEAGLIAFADYRRQGTSLVIPHVEASPALRGKGTADRLMRAIAAYAREQHLVITPLCGYARAWFRRHSEEQDLLDADLAPRN